MHVDVAAFESSASPADQLSVVLSLRHRTMRREEELLVDRLLASPWLGVRSVTLQWLVDRPTQDAAGALLAHARRLSRLPNVGEAEVRLLAVALNRAHAARYALRLFQLRSREITPLRFLPEIASELRRVACLRAAVEEARSA